MNCFAEEHPLANAKAGDWAEYTTVSKAGGMSSSSVEREEVIQKTPGEVTIEVTLKLGGQELKQPYTVKLNEKFDYRLKSIQAADFKSSESGRGEETLTVAGKAVKAQWVSYEESFTANGRAMKTTTKIWTAAGIPLGGLVKMETDLGGGGKRTRALTTFGSR